MTYIPNLLTVLRIISIPFIIYHFVNGNYYLAVLIFILSVITDFLDGYIARRYNLMSELGRLLDPFADKLMVISLMVMLIYLRIIPNIIALIILSREIFIFLGSFFAYAWGKDIVSPSYIGKLAIFLLYIAIAASILHLQYIDIIFFYAVIPLNIISAAGYIIKAVQRFQTE